MKLLVFTTLALVVAEAHAERKANPALNDFIWANVQFTSELYQKVLKLHPGNLLVCPWSVQTLLALVQAGATNNTAAQLSTALHLPENVEKLQEIFTNISSIIRQNNSTFKFTTANKIYIDNEFPIKDEFKALAIDVFSSEVQNIDFSKNEQAADEINKWVEEKTQDKIKNLITPGDVDQNSRVVLINAVYFKGAWRKPFKLSQKGSFNVNKQKQIEVDMMIQTNSFYYYESSDAQFLEMEYESGELSMVVILPNDIEGLQALEESTAGVLIENGGMKKIEVQIPKFKIETTIEYTPILQAMGVVDAFEGHASFRKMTEEKVAISKVIQKAFIEVDEIGTTAAAATKVNMKFKSDMVATSPATKFIADRPFAYLIKYQGVVLFVGHYIGE